MKKGLVVLMSNAKHLMRFRHKRNVIGGAIRDKQSQNHKVMHHKQEQLKKLANPLEKRFLKLKL